MFRKLLLSTVLTVGTLTGLAVAASPADAHQPVRQVRHGVEVIYRCGRGWDVYGRYVNRIEAVDRLDRFGGGKGGFWEDRGYQWYAGL